MDIEIQNISALHKRNFLAVSFFVYPYSRKINAEHYEFLPYEDYANVVAEGKKSPYFIMKDSSPKIFGFLLGLLIAGVFFMFQPALLASVEAIVSVIGAYAIGKELWVDIDHGLRHFTKKWSVSWRPATYSLEREDFGTVARFYKFARKKRYGMETILASFIDFTGHSNAKVLDLCYTPEDLSRLQGSAVRLMTIEINPEKLKALKDDGHFFSTKITLTRKFLFFQFNREYFQCLDGNNIGIIDQSEKWLPKNILYRRTINIRRLKFYITKKMLPAMTLIEQ